MRIDRSGRKGKAVTVAAPFFLSRDETLQLLKRFKQKCGCGGALKPVDDRAGRDGWVLELQGERREQVLTELAALGFPAKPSGG
ncbi:MAG: translation initiation factor [Acidobacteriota bacterium]|nr:translation initiation factor [Acidobacteriota bacterium]MDH3786731.1 translation initiation factor [Acidobacteriota bacterium]